MVVDGLTDDGQEGLFYFGLGRPQFYGLFRWVACGRIERVFITFFAEFERLAIDFVY